MKSRFLHPGDLANLVCILVVVLILIANTARAQGTFVVNKLTDTNDGVCDVSDCSLREAIAAASAGGTITFTSGLSGTITVGSTLSITSTNLTIAGPGPNTITVSGGDTVGIFNVMPNASLT